MRSAFLSLFVLILLLLLALPSEGQVRPRSRSGPYELWLHPYDCGCDECRAGRHDRRYSRDYRRREQGLNGIRAGLNVSYLYLEKEKFYPDNMASYFIAYQRESRFLPLLLYGAGLELYVNGGRDNFREELRMLYLALPLSLRINISSFYLKGGALGAIRLSAQEYENGQQIDLVRGKYRIFDYGLFVGGGARFSVLFIELRHLWGQVDIVNQYTTRQWQLGGGIMF